MRFSRVFLNNRFTLVYYIRNMHCYLQWTREPVRPRDLAKDPHPLPRTYHNIYNIVYYKRGLLHNTISFGTHSTATTDNLIDRCSLPENALTISTERNLRQICASTVCYQYHIHKCILCYHTNT